MDTLTSGPIAIHRKTILPPRKPTTLPQPDKGCMQAPRPQEPQPTRTRRGGWNHPEGEGRRPDTDSREKRKQPKIEIIQYQSVEPPKCAKNGKQAIFRRRKRRPPPVGFRAPPHTVRPAPHIRRRNPQKTGNKPSNEPAFARPRRPTGADRPGTAKKRGNAPPASAPSRHPVAPTRFPPDDAGGRPAAAPSCRGFAGGPPSVMVPPGMAAYLPFAYQATPSARQPLAVMWSYSTLLMVNRCSPFHLL